MASNLVDLINLLIETGDKEPDPSLKEGQVYTPDGSIVTL